MMSFSGILMFIFIALNIAQCLSSDIFPGNDKEKESPVYTKQLKGQNVVLLIKNRGTTEVASIAERYLMISVNLPSPSQNIDAWINHILHHLIPENKMKRHATAEKKELPNHDKTIDYSNINLEDIILVIYNQDYKDPNSKKANLYAIQKENGKYSLKIHEQDNLESLLKINIQKNPQTHIKKNISKGDNIYINKIAEEKKSIAQCPPNCVNISAQTTRNNSISEVKEQYTKMKENRPRDNISDSKFVDMTSGYDNQTNSNVESVENHGQNHKEMFLQNVDKKDSKSVAVEVNESYVESICSKDNQEKDKAKKVESSSQNYKTTLLRKDAKKNSESVVTEINAQSYVESVFSNDQQKNDKREKVERCSQNLKARLLQKDAQKDSKSAVEVNVQSYVASTLSNDHHKNDEVENVERNGQYHKNTLLENNAQKDSKFVAVSIHAKSYAESISFDDHQKNKKTEKVESHGQYHKTKLSVKNDQKDSEAMDVEIHAQSYVTSALSGNFDVKQTQENSNANEQGVYQKGSSFSQNKFLETDNQYITLNKTINDLERENRSAMYENKIGMYENSSILKKHILQHSKAVADKVNSRNFGGTKMYNSDILSDKEYLQKYSTNPEPPYLEAHNQSISITAEFSQNSLRDNKSEMFNSTMQIYTNASFTKNNIQQGSKSIAETNDFQSVNEAKMNHYDISSDKKYLQRYSAKSESPHLEASEQPISITTKFSRDDLKENTSETYETQIQAYEDVSFSQNEIQQDTELVSEKNISQNVDETKMHYDILSHKEYLQKYSTDPQPPYLKRHNPPISITTEFSRGNLRANNSNMHDSTIQIHANASLLKKDIKHTNSQSIDKTTMHYDISSNKEYLQKYVTYPEPPYLEEYGEPIPVTIPYSRSNIRDNKSEMYKTSEMYENGSFLKSNTQKDIESVTKGNDSQSADETKVHYDISCHKKYLQEHSIDPQSSYLDADVQSNFIDTDFPRYRLKDNKPEFRKSESQNQQKSTTYQAAAMVESETELKNVSTTGQTVIQQESTTRNMLAFQPTSKPLTFYNMLKNISEQTGVITEIPKNVQKKFQSRYQLSTDSGIGLDLKNNLKLAILSKNADISNRSVSEVSGKFQTSVKNINSTNLLYTWKQENASNKLNNLQNHLNATSIFLSRAENTTGYPLLEQSSQNNSKISLTNFSRNEDEAKFLVPANDRREIVKNSVQSSNQRVTEENISVNVSQTNSKSSLSLNHQIQNKSAERLQQNYSYYLQNSKLLSYPLNNKLNSNQINDGQDSIKDAHSQLDLNKHPDLLRKESQSAHNYTSFPYALFPYNKSETNQKSFPFHMYSNTLDAAHINDELDIIVNNISIKNTSHKFIYGMSLKYPAQLKNDSHSTNATDNSHILQNRTSITKLDIAKNYSHLEYKQRKNTVGKKYGDVFRNNFLGLVARKIYQSNKGPTSQNDRSLKFENADENINSEILTQEKSEDSSENHQWYTNAPLNVLPMYRYPTMPSENKKIKWKGNLKVLKHFGTDAESNPTSLSAENNLSSKVLSTESNPSLEVLSKKPTMFIRNQKKTGLNSISASVDKEKEL